MKTLKVLAVLAVMGLGVLGASTPVDACLAAGCTQTGRPIQISGWSAHCFLVTYNCPGNPNCMEIECFGY